MSTTRSGQDGERVAVSYLKSHGYRVIQTNFRSKFGEIDIVALEGNVLVFVEVKTRWSKEYGYPEEAVTPWKLRSIIKTADYYKLMHPRTPALMRIDVVAVEAEGRVFQDIRLIKNVTG